MKKTKSILYFIIIVCFSLSSCTQNRDSSSSINIPSFGVEPLLSGPDQSSTNSRFVTKKSTNAQNDDPLIEIPNTIRISCELEIELLNNSPQLLDPNLDYIDYLESFYAMTNFYDCNIRQQVQESNNVVRLDSGQYISSEIDSDNPQDNTRFVSWIYDEGEKIARGKLVNLYLQDDGIRTKTRIDLSHKDGNKVVNSFLYFSDPGIPPTLHKFYTRVLFKEITDDNGEVTEHRIGGRHYNTFINAVIAFAAVVKKGVGSAVFLKKCENTDDAHAPCNLSSTYEKKYYDANGEVLASAPDGMPATLEDIGLDHTTYMLSDFYNGQTEGDYFHPSFDPESD